MHLARDLLWVFVEMTVKISFQRLDLSALKGLYTNTKVIAVSPFLLIQRHGLVFYISKDSEIFRITQNNSYDHFNLLRLSSKIQNMNVLRNQ